MQSIDFKLRAEDGFELPAVLVRPEVSNGIAVQINPAALTPLRYYRTFAEHMAARGFTMLIYEVRGGLQLTPDSHASLDAWGRLDHTAATRYLRREYPQLALAVIGHSMGGQLLGMSPLAGEARAVLLVACAHGYWRRAAGGPLTRLYRGAMAVVVGPLLIALLGYLPAFVLGGARKSASYGRELLRCLRSPHFFCDEKGRPLRPYHGQIRAPLRHIVLEDDHRVPPGAEMDVSERYPNADAECIVIAPRQYGVDKIDHHGLFHRSMARPAWDDIAGWLEAAVRRRQPPAPTLPAA